ncbi:RadC family protein [Peloplasma aerotolerans]|uniref:DNA repair protein RadC n=1 Tax=Peloplasma aerotolerans TaxID=3044389 RepID=A0AAW6U7B3_9MOLU|nr:DNA repair protein RadC [Mariniplasma sp. M4Ah]MDI6451953.1 DNA repair protein RadC [Mariniplasma sp. M4Ah]
MYLVKEMPKEERPRERLLAYGANALSNEELLAILLRTGRKDLSVLELSKNVLYHLESLEDLKRMTVQELLQVKGIKEAKATTIIAAIELGKRLSNLNREKKSLIQSPYDVYMLLHHELSHLEQEHFICIYLNTKSEVIKKDTIFIGTINQTLIHPREIYKHAIKLSAAAVLFVHNHPSGDSTPSKADIKATTSLMEASTIMGIDLIDHIIIGHHEYYSLKEQKKTKI